MTPKSDYEKEKKWLKCSKLDRDGIKSGLISVCIFLVVAFSLRLFYCEANIYYCEAIIGITTAWVVSIHQSNRRLWKTVIELQDKLFEEKLLNIKRETKV